MQYFWNPYSIPSPEAYKAPAKLPYMQGDEENVFANLFLACPKVTAPKGSPLIVYFHGGGLTGGDRNCLPFLYNGKNAVAEVRYPLAPSLMPPGQIDYAASAIGFLVKNAEKFNIDKRKIFIGGHSAGAYLAAIAVMNPAFSRKYGFHYKDIAGLILLSGQMTTHFFVKEVLGDKRGNYYPKIDEYAPLAHLAEDLPPILLITGESGRDIPGRPEENLFTAASLRAIGHPFVRYFALAGHDHCSIMTGAVCLVSQFTEDVLKGIK